MKNHYLSLLSVSALAIAVMASAASEVEAQCSKGCFGYPTPNQTVTRSYVPAVQYQVLPSQTFVQPIVFAAPEYLPVQSYSPVQPQVFEPAPEYLPVQNYSPVQPQVFESTPQFVPSAPIVQPMPIASVPEQRTGSSLPAEVYIPPTEVVEPDTSIESSSVTPLEIPVPPVVDPIGEMKKVQEGEIEGEIISPASDDLGLLSSVENTASDVPLTETKEVLVEEKAAMEKAEMEKATERKAAKEKAGKKVLTKQERIAKLEVSLQRQIQRAQQKSEKQLRKQLKGLKTDGDVSKEKINSLKQEAADALKVKLAEIEKRVQARIDQLEE